jgi:hypothetical protein
MRRIFLLIFVCLAWPLSARAEEVKALPIFAEDGAFKFCGFEHAYADQTKLALAMNGLHQINLGVTIPKAGFKKGAGYDVAYGFDALKPQKIIARAVSEESLVLPLEVNPPFAKDFSNSTNLNLSGGGKKRLFNVAALHATLPALTQCVADNKDKVRQATPLPASVKTLLTEAGEQKIEALSLEGIPADSRPADYMWRAGALTGGILTLEAPKDQTLDALIGIYVAGLKKKCTGDFKAEIGKENAASPALRLRPALVACHMKKEAQDLPIVSALLFTLSDDHRLVLFTHETDPAHQAEAIKVRDALAAILLKRALSLK